MNRSPIMAILAAAIVVLVVAGAVIGNYFITLHEVSVSNQRWCATLTTLNNADSAALRAPASEKPKGAYSFALIRDFRQLRDQICG